MQPNQLLDRLNAIRSRVRLLAIATGAALAFATIIGLLVALPVSDYLLNLPGAARLLLALAALGMLGYVSYRFIFKPAVAKLTLGDIAGRVEGTFPEFDDRLRSTVNFLSESIPGSDVMKDRVTAETAELAGKVDFGRVVVTKPLWQSIGLAAGSLAVLLLLALLVGEQYRTIAIDRLFRPFGDTRWPRSVQIAMQSDVPTRVTAGQRVYFNVKLTRGDKASRKAKLYYQYPNQKPVEELMARDEKGLYSGFHDAKLDSDVASGNVKVWIEAGDDRYDIKPITIVPKLAITHVDAIITPPKYANLPATTVNLRETPAVMAAGANVVMRVQFNKPLNDKKPLVLESTKPDAALPQTNIARDGDRTAVITFSPRASAELRVKGVDIDDFTNESNEAYTFTIRPDQNPTVLLELPRGNEERTPVAIVPMAAVAEDDYGIKTATLNIERLGDHRKWTLPLVTESAALESVVWNKIDGSGDLQRFRLNYSWDLSKLETGNLQPGDVLEYGVSVTDNFALDGQTHPPVMSGKQRITIISQETFTERVVEQIRNASRQTGEIRNSQQRTLVDTKDLQQSTEKKEKFDDADKSTAERLANQQSSAASQAKQVASKMDALAQKMDENKSPAADMKQTAQDVSAMLNRIADGPQKDATDKINDAKDNPTPKEARNEKLTDATHKQQDATDQLQKALDRMGNVGTLANTIDQIKKLLDEQVATSKETQKIGAQNLGKKPSDMKPEDKKALDKNAQDQKNLAERTQKAIDDMKQTADQLSKADPSTAQAMKEAATAAQQQQVTQNQQKAAQSASQNQQSQAQSAQKQAELGLQMMLSALKEAEKRKLEELASQLTELKKQIANLVRRQAGHNLDNVTIQGNDKLMKIEAAVLTDLFTKAERAKDTPPAPPTVPQLSASQEQTERNTRDIAHTAEDVQGAADVAAALSRAAGKMGSAIVWLRQGKLPDAYDPPQVEALHALSQAYAAAEEMLKKVQDKQEQQKKEAIRAALQKIRDEQDKLNQTTITIDKSPRNADKQYARPWSLQLAGLPGEQGKLADRTSAVGEDLSSVGGVVFVWAVKDVVGTMNNVKDDLAKPATGEPTQAEQSKIVEQLDAMIAALAVKPPDQKFEQKSGDGGGGGAGGGGPKLPTEAELQLLKAMQVAVNNVTKKINDLPAKDKDKLLEVGGRQGELRGVYGELMKKASRGKIELGPEPDNKNALPEESGEEAVNNQELQDNLLGANPNQQPEADQAQRVGSRMARSRQRLALNSDPGKVTQLIQQKILDDMDALIEEARKQQAQSQSKPGQGKPGEGMPKPGDADGGKPQNANGQGKGQKPGQQIGGTSPAGDSSLSGAGSNNADLSKDIHTAMTEWGGLTQRQREAVLESKGETVIEKYRNYLDDYYKSLATKSTERQ